MKSSWACMGQSNMEEEMLNQIQERGLTYGVSNLIVAWMVQIGGVDNSTDLHQPNYIQFHLSEDQQPEVQVQHWILLNPVGMCYNFLPFSCLLSYHHSTISLLPLCSPTWGDPSLLTRLPALLIFSAHSSLVSYLYRTVSLFDYLSHGSHVSPIFHQVL